MQIFDYSPIAGQPASQGAFKRMSLVFKYGAERTAEMEAQLIVMDLLSKYLDDRYSLLRNVTLPDLEVPIPLILIGPPGIHLIYVTPLRGIYRARGDLWFVVDTRRRFRPAAPNLIIRSTLMARAIQVFLERRGFPETKIEPVLVSTASGLYIEAIRPTIRIVMSDAIDRFIAGLQQGELVLTKPEVETLVGLLTTRTAVETPSIDSAAPAAVEVFVPEPVLEETPSWMEDRIAALEDTPAEEPAEELDVPVADEKVAAEAQAEWVSEEILPQAQPVNPGPAGIAEAAVQEQLEEEALSTGEVLSTDEALSTRQALLPTEAGPLSVERVSPSFTSQQKLILGILVVMILLVVAAFVFLLLMAS